MTLPDFSSFLPLLHACADAGGAEILKRWRKAGFEDKPDLTPVTAADREAEKAIRALLEETRPRDGIWGEEFGRRNPDAEFCWVIDPVDGTKAFLRGMPVFVTLIGLLHRGKPVLGVIDQPVLKERWTGGAGVPAMFNGAPARARRCARLEDAVMNTSDPSLVRNPVSAPIEKLGRACTYASCGGDGYVYGLLASGHIDVIADAGLKPHDFAALAPVIAAAGGVACDWRGNPLDAQSAGDVLALGNPALLDEALGYLKS